MDGALPKLKKKLSGFFTDESGKISKENILTMGLGGMILLGFLTESSVASHGSGDFHSSTVPHSSGVGTHISAPHVSGPLAGHASGARNGIVNELASAGHLSAPHVSGNTHGSHGSHASHTSHVNVDGDG